MESFAAMSFLLAKGSYKTFFTIFFLLAPALALSWSQWDSNPQSKNYEMSVLLLCHCFQSMAPIKLFPPLSLSLYQQQLSPDAIGTQTLNHRSMSLVFCCYVISFSQRLFIHHFYSPSSFSLYQQQLSHAASGIQTLNGRVMS